MGKDLKGKELGAGLLQRKNGIYVARFTDRRGKRKEKNFKKLQEARKWLADSKYEDEHGTIYAGDGMTVDAWFSFWMDNIKGDTIRPKSIETMKERYKANIRDCIGDMVLSEVKTMHCQNIVSLMSKNYRLNTIQKTLAVLHAMFQSAEENEVIERNPVKRSIKCRSEIQTKETRVLDVKEQSIFLNAIKGNYYEPLYRFALQTGMRSGELTGLQWGDIDLKRNILTVNRTMDYKSREIGWVSGEPKSKSGHRTIPLTDEAVEMLKMQREISKRIKTIAFEYRDQVFLTLKGNPITTSAIDRGIKVICKNAGLEDFSMHCLRHTFATRCIESGMTPKILQKILGHSSINMTMNLYVHATEDAKEREMKMVQDALRVV